MKITIENIGQVDFGKSGGLVPVIVQDVHSGSVLMLAYMTEEALEKTLSSGNVTFYSRSRNEIWTKGDTSGNFIKVHSIDLDCDRDTLLITGVPTGPVCHTGEETCFGLRSDFRGFLHRLEEIIDDRRKNPSPESYTSRLFELGENKIVQKVGEEAVELVIEAKGNDKNLLVNEAADLLYHFLVLLNHKDVGLSEIEKCLRERHMSAAAHKKP